MNTPKMHDNTKVQAFLFNHYYVTELCETFPQIDDIFSGILELKTPGDTSTRSLSRTVLFHILQWCPVIDVASIERVTHGRYAYRSLAGYAASARVASKAVERFIDTLPGGRREMSTKQAQEAIDAPHMAELEGLSLI